LRHEYASSYSDHFKESNLQRPSSAPPSTTPRRHPQYDPSYTFASSPLHATNLIAPAPYEAPASPSTPRPAANYGALHPSSPTSGSPKTPRHRNHPSQTSADSPLSPRYDPTNDVSSSPTSRYAKYNWNKGRNPLLDGEGQRSPSGRKSVPSYFDNLEKEDEDSKRLARKSRPEPTPFMIDPSRAGIPTLIQKIRTHEEDIYHKQKRPASAPTSPLMRWGEDIPAGAQSPKHYSRRPCQIEKFNVRRNPLIESGDFEQPRKQLIGFNRESEDEIQLGRKTNVVPPSLQKVTRTKEYFIPGELPTVDPIRLRINHPGDSDIFNTSHPLVSPSAPHLMGAIEREEAQRTQEVALDAAYQDRVQFYNDEIKKFKAKAKLKSGGF